MKHKTTFKIYLVNCILFIDLREKIGNSKLNFFNYMKALYEGNYVILFLHEIKYPIYLLIKSCKK